MVEGICPFSDFGEFAYGLYFASVMVAVLDSVFCFSPYEPKKSGNGLGFASAATK